MNVWVEAARPRTLGAGVVPVLVGTAASGRFNALRFIGALVVGVSIQVAVNFANDYFDGVRGVDSTGRTGPRRAVAAGLVAPAAMKRAVVAALGVAALAGVALAVAVGYELLLVGLASFAALLGYSGGPRPYASYGLGEFFVFVFFGLVATVGSAYVQIERVTALAFVSAIPVGLMATALLVANNLRDIPTDEAAGKRTLAVRLGAARTRMLFSGLIVLSFAAIPVVGLVAEAADPLMALAALPAAIVPLRIVHTEREPRALIGALGGTARLQMVFGILLSVGLWIAAS